MHVKLFFSLKDYILDLILFVCFFESHLSLPFCFYAIIVDHHFHLPTISLNLLGSGQFASVFLP